MAPTLFVNEQPQTPAFYALTHAYGGRWSWEEVPARNLNNFCNIGFRLYQVDLYLQDIWYKNSNALDIEKAQKQVKSVLDQCPDAHVVIRIHVNAPAWWNEINVHQPRTLVIWGNTILFLMWKRLPVTRGTYLMPKFIFCRAATGYLKQILTRC